MGSEMCIRDRWIVIYPVDSAIQRLNNWSLVLAGDYPFWEEAELILTSLYLSQDILIAFNFFETENLLWFNK